MKSNFLDASSLSARIAVAVALSSSALVAEEVGISLSDAVGTALRQNPAVKIQQTSIEQKSGLLDQASGQFDWFVGSSVTEQKTRVPTVGLPGTNPVDSSTQTNYSVGVTKELRNGITITPSVSASIVDTRSPTSGSVGTSQVGFVIDVPLLRGLGRDDTGAAEAAARGDVAVARLLYEQALSAQALGTASSYWSSRAADEVLQIQRDVEKNAEQLVQSTKVLVDARLFPPAFLLQAEANLRDKRTTRIEAEIAARNARMSLATALGLAPEQMADAPAAKDAFPALGDEITSDSSRRAALIRRALASRSDLEAARKSEVPLNILERQAELELKPQLNLAVSAGYAGLNTGPNLITPLSRRLTGANGQIGLSLEWPTLNTYQKGLLRQRKGDVQSAQEQTEQLSQAIAGSVVVAFEEVRLLSDQVRSAQDTVQIATKAVAAQHDQLKSGEGTVLDLITLENLLSSARVSYANTYASYATAVANLRYNLGEMFGTAPKAPTTLEVLDLTTLPPL